MQKLVARTMIVMLLISGLSGLFMARPARAASRSGTILFLGAIAGGVYYYLHRKKEREQSAMLPSDSKYLKSDRTAQAGGTVAAPGSLAASKPAATSEAAPVSGSVALNWPTPTSATTTFRQPAAVAQ